MRTALLALALAALALPAAAQGTLTGTVTDASTGETLPGANVLVLGTTRGAAADLDGRYRVADLRAGDYTIRVSFAGLQTVEYTGIRVTNGETTTLDAALRPVTLGGDEGVVVVGERPLIDVERAESAYTVSQEEIDARPVRDVQGVVANQAGVTQDPTGLYIRGGRATETGFLVDGVSAKDPLSGTGFGLDLGANALREVEVVTTGADASVGDATSGVISIRTREGTDEFSASLSVQRDNFGFNEDWASSNNEDTYEASVAGPILPGRLRFFLSGQSQFSDNFTRQIAVPEQVSSSLFDAEWLTPRMDNRWSGLLKLTFLPRTGTKLDASYQRSIAINQNTRMLQVTSPTPTRRTPT
jgi:hypothetical protein